MKKTLLSLLVMLCAAATASAVNITVDGLCYQVSGTNLSVVNDASYATALSGSLVIPGQVTYEGTTYTVNQIGYNAFRNCSAITSVVIPNTVTIVGYNSFYGCSGITSIDVPEGVKTISECAFAYCTSLASITIPSTVTSIANPNTATNNKGILYECDNLESIVIASGNATYDSRNNCNAIIETASNKLIIGCKGTTFPATVTTIGRNAFRETKITDVALPEGVTTLEPLCFNGCFDLKTLSIPSTLTTIGDNAFNGCSALESIVVAEANTTFDSRDNCNAIIKTSENELVLGCKTTVIPASVITIGMNAFRRNTITDVVIPEGVTTIANYAFFECTQLKTVTLPSTLKNIKYGAFQVCNSLTDIYAYPHANVETGDTVTLQDDIWAFMDEPWTAAECNLHVYPEDVEYYSNADQWKEFNVVADLGETQEALYLFGSWDWTTGTAFVKGDDGLWTATKEIAIGDEFKLVDQDDVWYGGVDDNGVGYFEITSGLINNGITLVTPGANFKMAVAGTYTLTADLVNKTLTLKDAAAGKPGDANEDGEVNVQDITTIINYILGNNPSPFNFNNANVNGDAAVNVQDVTLIINMILGVN